MLCLRGTESFSGDTELCFADIHDGDGSSSSGNQSLRSTAKWASSLENLLEDPEGVKRFRVCLFNVL